MDIDADCGDSVHTLWQYLFPDCNNLLHLWKITFQSACPLCSDRIDVNLYDSDINPVIIVKSIKQIVLTLIIGKLHCHIKVRAFTL